MDDEDNNSERGFIVSGTRKRQQEKMPALHLSQHPKLVKRRQRKMGMNETTAVVEKAKKADRVAG
jgi:hypothetical protein